MVPLSTLKTPKQNFFLINYTFERMKRSVSILRKYFLKIQVLGLLGHLSTYITVLTLNAY